MPTNLELAAENARLRTELKAAFDSLEEIDCGDAQCQSQYDGCNQACRSEAYKAARRIDAALATDPGPLVAAIQGVVATAKVFAELANKADHFGHADDSTCAWRLRASELRDLRAALAAYRAAMGGTDGPR